MWTASEKYLKDTQDPFSEKVQKTLVYAQQKKELKALLKTEKSFYRKNLLKTIHLGLQGHSILDSLMILEKEVELECEAEVEKFLKSLPFRALFPLFFLCFPSFLCLLFGPFLMELLKNWQGGL